MLVLLLCVCVAHVCAAKTICVFFLRAQTNKLHATIHTYRQQQRQRSESNNNNNRRSADNNNKMGHHKGRPSEFENWFPDPGSRSFEARRNCHEYIFRVGVPQWTIPRFTNNKYHVHIPCLLFIARLWLFLTISIECINFVSINERICFIPFFFLVHFFRDASFRNHFVRFGKCINYYRLTMFTVNGAMPCAIFEWRFGVSRTVQFANLSTFW